jgi:NlpC/P60 family putative phage cell wall peptidase
MLRQRIIDEAMTWLGTPYHHQARVKGCGVDCAQLLIQVFHNVGLVPIINPGNYPQDWHMHRSEEQFLNWVKKYARQVSNPLPGDVALFRFGRCVSHGAIMLDKESLIHAYFNQGCIIGNINGVELKNRVHSFWTLCDGN